MTLRTRLVKQALWLGMLTVVSTIGVQAQGPLQQCDNHLVTIEKDGSVSAGSKKSLIAAYRKGAPIRVGWELDWDDDGKSDITHWTFSHFLSEFEGEIFAQIPMIQQQRPRRGEANIVFPDKNQEWYGILRSDGQLSGRYSEREGMSKSYRVRSVWCVGSSS